MFSKRFLLGGLAACLVFGWWSCTEVAEGGKVHPDKWDDPSDAFHGDKIRAVGLSGCVQCHGEKFSGGTSGVACSECHSDGGAIPHPPLAEYIDPSHDNYHGRIFWLNNWDFSSCQACHGQNLEGGVVESACSNTACHTASGGIFACDNCHNTQANDSFIDVRNQTGTDLVTVGTHTSHYTHPDSLTVNIDCASCHLIPDSVWAEGHIDETPYAEVPFGIPTTADSTFTLSWDRNSATCSNSYCHGNFRFEKATSSNIWIYADSLIVGNNQTVTWTDTLTAENRCATCHSYPPTGHLQLSACGDCHTSVAGEDHLSIIDTQKHINGRADYP
ncbi:MAG: CxxxxCH/CxxCH domain-containing protein [Fidelibacterota bacterium]|nr:MAG: CxxxxCH/CxxCH domain-containing protein [Candidatus Neomarinimicrobiota bacterium]